MNDDRFHLVPVNFVHQRARRELSDAAARLDGYLVLNEHANAIGCYRLPLGYVANDLGWDVAKARTAMQELGDTLSTACDEAVEWVFIPSRLATVRPSNQSHGTGLQKHAQRVPVNASFYAAFVAGWNAVVGRYPQWLKALPAPENGGGSPQPVDRVSPGSADKERKIREPEPDRKPDPEALGESDATGTVVTLPGVVVEDARQGSERTGKIEPTGNGGPGGKGLSDLVWERWRANVTAYAMEHGTEGQRVKFSGSVTVRRKDLTVAGQQLLDYWDEKMRADPAWMQARKRASA